VASTPRASHLSLPPSYGRSTELLAWEAVRDRLASARVYWFASTRADRRPHVVARDGIWLEDALWYGGSDDTVHARNVRETPQVAAHIGDGTEAVIVEGVVQPRVPDPPTARSLAAAAMRKYPGYGTIDPVSYATGVWVLQPRRVLAWTRFPTDATRFVFEP
jgi:hypothetical protein